MDVAEKPRKNFYGEINPAISRGFEQSSRSGKDSDAVADNALPRNDARPSVSATPSNNFYQMGVWSHGDNGRRNPASSKQRSAPKKKKPSPIRKAANKAHKDTATWSVTQPAGTPKIKNEASSDEESDFMYSRSALPETEADPELAATERSELRMNRAKSISAKCRM